MSDKLYLLYMAVLGIAAITSLVRFRITEKGTRFMSGFIWLGLLTEIIARYAAIAYRNNLPILNISCIIEFVLICCYYNATISYFKRNNIGIIIAGAGIIIGVITLLIFDSFFKINSNFLFIESLGIICMSLYAIFRMLLMENEKLHLQLKVQFWIPIILVMYQAGTIWSWMMYEYFRLIGESETQFLHQTLLSNGIVIYLAFTMLFLCYPKMKNIYV